MKTGKSLAILTVAGALALGMAGCGDPAADDNTTTPPASEGTAGSGDTSVDLTMSAWSLETTPEFETLVDGFMADNPNVNIELVEYDPNTYEQLLLTDMTAQSAPDIITIKQAKYTWQWASAGQLLDISDLVGALPDTITGAASYTVEDKNYGMPYRQDSWVLFYNKDLFDLAGVAIPDGQWTWEDYVANAKDLTEKLAAAGSAAKGAYEHSWQSTLQGFANAQAGDVTNLEGPFFAGEYDYMLPYYERVLDLQNSGAQVTLGDITTNQLTYQAQFGKQDAAMMMMGSWYIATLRSQQTSGDADAFTWGMSPVPQVDDSTFDVPVTFGDPTGIGINANIDPAKEQAAKDFLNYIVSEKAATDLAGIGITPSMSADAVTDAIFAGEHMPTDDLSRTAFQVHSTQPENPSGSITMNIATILAETHTNILSGSMAPADALADASQRVQDQDW